MNVRGHGQIKPGDAIYTQSDVDISKKQAEFTFSLQNKYQRKLSVPVYPGGL